MAGQKIKVREKNNPLRSPENAGSDEPVVLDADTQAATLKSINDIMGALAFVRDYVKENTLKVSVRHNGLSVARSEFAQVEKNLGADADVAQYEQLKKNMLREANAELHRLRQEMGNGVSVDGLAAKIYQMTQTTYNWWQNIGFTYSKSTVQAWSRGGKIQVEFSVRVERHIGTMEEKPVTAKARVDAKKKALGQELEIVYDGDEPYVIDTPNNRKWLMNKIRGRFPDTEFYSWDIRSIPRSHDQFHISEVKVGIDFLSIGEYEKNEKYDG